MVAVLSIDKAVDRPSDNIIIGQTLNTWVKLSWDEFIQVAEDPKYQKYKFYYCNGEARVEPMSTGSDHSDDHALIVIAIGLFVAVNGLDIRSKDNCSYRKVGIREFQPDISYYVGDRAQLIPWGTGVVDLDIYPAPDLAIEIANSSWADDVGKKRLLYEDLGVKEYWVINVKSAEILAFAIADSEGARGSYRITRSQVITGLEIALLEEALRLSRENNHGQVTSWILTQLQKA
ncbi:MAG: Uma2 family endonuclease [Pseudanabaena sp.]|jgi:Uma2 family endonuclease|nr:Uma2 family endonuclease [Pseudanabaena sp. M090S1SP2A07QC]MCA6505301.1 Uma2 family endonuclease [Pseudanabaena sp. M172S2SP2A07QC]MCA6509807.1 Uma2 family endonuclease [Pseudanabaena sp. M109S1SP2A07QC]MCA6518448.1 Uma2 family endonuclease [Pseudanabaena sp. M110S1SP2A07QC]MCA6521706.1 Uma2 family endonuclease [Pseudanabaena sp. M051S1SP2A07QC]MCA6527876.1 Uma2 family endonuclease [Pseudanabaena sp. M179S2SP2A07QC]MCA6529691.1 Uma2 family endonuclease [Pseudanabaena sp. M125S2SP2A07QC]MC